MNTPNNVCRAAFSSQTLQRSTIVYYACAIAAALSRKAFRTSRCFLSPLFLVFPISSTSSRLSDIYLIRGPSPTDLKLLTSLQSLLLLFRFSSFLFLFILNTDVSH